MKEQLQLQNLEECVTILNTRGDLPADLYMDFTSGDVWVPEYPRENTYTVQFCRAVERIHEFPACDLKQYTKEEIKQICEDAYVVFLED